MLNHTMNVDITDEVLTTMGVEHVLLWSINQLFTFVQIKIITYQLNQLRLTTLE